MRHNYLINTIFNRKYLFLLLIAIFFSQNLVAQKPIPKRSLEITPKVDKKIESEYKNNIRVNADTGIPIALCAVNFDVPQGTPEQKAMFYLNSESKKLGISKNKIASLQHYATRTTNAGSVVRYRQYHNGYPVNKAEVTISISPQNQVVFVMNSYESNIDLPNTQPSVSEQKAYQLAFDYLNVSSQVSFKKTRMTVYSNKKMTRLAHEVIISATQPLGEWHVFVDANTEEIFKVVDMAYYCSDSDKEKTTKKSTNTTAMTVVDGTGFVFNPDPLSSNTVAYGGNYSDNGDATNTDLDNARFRVTLNNIEEIGGVFKLKGPFAEIVDHEAPTEGVFTQNSSDFSFNRQDQGFEAVNAYYHIDFLMDYINNTLGIPLMPYQYTGGVQYDPHGLDGADNSHYTSGDGRLAWGEGGVDDAEDSDVIHHELGHGLHDWVTMGSLSQVDGLSEGSGDYIAQSYNRSLDLWAPTDPAYNWVFNWDGHNEFFLGRITNYGSTYPGGLVGQIHTDGQIWSTCLMKIWDQIGQQEMDKIFYEGLGMTNSSSNQNDAANAVYQAAINLSYTTAQIAIIHASLTACGYTLPALPEPPVAAFNADTTTICLDNTNTVNFTDDSVSAPAATSWSWTFEGGTPATSTAQNPTVTYAVEGTYDVTLMVTNDFGTDTLTETDYITVVAGVNCPACTTVTNNTVVVISDGVGSSYNSIINISSVEAITDVNVTINIDHSRSDNLDITLTSPTGTIVELTSDNGGIGDNYIGTIFDQQATTLITAGSPPFTGLFIPEGDLNTFNGLDPEGDWTLTIVDNATDDGGQLNSWSLEVCVDNPTSVSENRFDNFSIYPNPNNGTFAIKLNSTSNSKINVQIYDISGKTILNNLYKNTFAFEKTIKLNSIQSGVYLIKVSDGERESIDKIIIK